jgi:hypothetical protein
MNTDRFDALERFVPMFEAPETSFEGFLRRRDRRRRKQRIAAGAVGIAVFMVAIWIATTGGPFDRTSTPASPGPTVAPPYPGQIGLVGLAPESARPSSPSVGELVLRFRFSPTGGDPGRFSGHLYADGRLIWERLGDPSGEGDATGLIEQHLSSDGVRLLKSEVLRTGLFDDGTLHLLTGPPGLYSGEIEVRDGERLLGLTWGGGGQHDTPKAMIVPEQARALEQLVGRLGDLASWLPASAWEDPRMRAFVPSRYSVCVEVEQEIGLDVILARFPQEAADLLRDRNWKHDEVVDSLGTTLDFWCSAVTTETARAIAQIVVAGDAEVSGDVFGAAYEVGRRDHPTGVRLSFEPMLPHDG